MFIYEGLMDGLFSELGRSFCLKGWRRFGDFAALSSFSPRKLFYVILIVLYNVDTVLPVSLQRVSLHFLRGSLDLFTIS